MAHVSLLPLSAAMFVPDQDAQLVAADLAALQVNHIGRPALAFDDTDEMAATSHEFPMPGQYAAGTLKATLYVYSATDNTNDTAFDVFVEAVTPNADTLDMETAEDWDTANSGTISLAGSTAGDLLTIVITLANKDGVVVGDLVRFGVRRDTDSGNDDVVGDMFLFAVDIWEDT